MVQKIKKRQTCGQVEENLCNWGWNWRGRKGTIILQCWLLNIHVGRVSAVILMQWLEVSRRIPSIPYLRRTGCFRRYNSLQQKIKNLNKQKYIETKIFQVKNFESWGKWAKPSCHNLLNKGFRKIGEKKKNTVNYFLKKGFFINV